MNREEAVALLTSWTTKEALIKHALGVEAAMRAYARQLGGDEDDWGITGLLHDFDYERYPDLADHPFKGAEYLRTINAPEPMIQAILGHASHTGVPRKTPMAKTLFAVDELVGLITAAALVQPDKKLASVTSGSVLRKMKDKAFARNVNRDEIREGAQALDTELEPHITFVIGAMQQIAPQLGL